MEESVKKKNGSRRNWYGWFLLISLILAGLGLWDRCQADRAAVRIDVAKTTVAVTPTIVTAAPARASAAPVPATEQIPVYLVGAVEKPGVYLIERGTYLYELIEQAGGLTAQAAADAINLAADITTNQLIRIPTRDEAAAGLSVTLSNDQTTATQLVDLNRADQKQLETLPGIGPATALAIIAYRTENGPFLQIEDLMQVPGIKEARYASLKDLVMVSAP